MVVARGADIELLERDEQLGRLGRAFELAREGQGRIIAIAAEAGAGKTTLVERFVAEHAARARVHWGACENLSTPEVLLPLRDIARASGESFDLGADHIRAFEWMLRLLSDGAGPSVLTIEDVHWADTATLDLIRFLARRIAGAAPIGCVSPPRPPSIMSRPSWPGWKRRLGSAPPALRAVSGCWAAPKDREAVPLHIGKGAPCVGRRVIGTMRLQKSKREPAMSRIGIFIYGIVCYLFFLVVFLYGIGTYIEYRASTPMLLPRLWPRR